MKQWISGCATLTIAVIVGAAAAAELEEIWEISGLKKPESVVFDAEREVLYVSNVDGEPQAKDGNGAISRVSVDGELLEYAWIDGLDAPKGLAILDGSLYAADIDELVEIDIESGRIVDRYPAEGAKFLNDAAAGPNGDVYVSDMQAAAIYRLRDGDLEKWLTNESGDLCAPNGLFAEDERLVVGCWTQTVGENAKPGRLKTVDYDSRQIETLSEGEPIGHIDGVEADGAGGYYLTDWMAGSLMHFEGGETRQLLDLAQGSADLGVISERDLILIPMMMNNSLRAYRIKE